MTKCIYFYAAKLKMPVVPSTELFTKIYALLKHHTGFLHHVKIYFMNIIKKCLLYGDFIKGLRMKYKDVILSAIGHVIIA